MRVVAIVALVAALSCKSDKPDKSQKPDKPTASRGSATESTTAPAPDHPRDAGATPTSETDAHYQTYGEWIAGLGTAEVAAAEIPPNIAIELSLLAGGPDTGVDPTVAWAQKLGTDQAVVEVVGTPPDDDYMNVDYGVLLLLRRDGDRAKIVSHAGTPGGSTKRYRSDIDGDGADDLFASFSWTFDDYGASGWAVALSNQHLVASFRAANFHHNDGVTPRSLVVFDDSWCATSISGTLALVAGYHWEATERDEDSGKEVTTERSFGIVAWVVRDGDLQETSVFAHWTQPRPGEPPEGGPGAAPKPCPGGALDAYVNGVDKTKPEDAGAFYRWAGFALTKAEAVELAAGAGVDATHVVETGTTPDSGAPDRL